MPQLQSVRRAYINQPLVLVRHVGAAHDMGNQRKYQFILAMIARMGEANLRQLEDTLAIDQTTLTRSLNLLERDRVIKRVPHSDGRIKALRLTSKGRRALETARPLWAPSGWA